MLAYQPCTLLQAPCQVSLSGFFAEECEQSSVQGGGSHAFPPPCIFAGILLLSGGAPVVLCLELLTLLVRLYMQGSRYQGST